MLSTHKFVFNRKNEKLKKGETALVQLRVTIDRVAKPYSTGIYLEKHQWSGVDNAWVVNTPLAADYNALLLDIITKVRKADIQAAQSNRQLSPEAVRQIVKGVDVSSFVNYMVRDSAERNDIVERTKGHAKLAAEKLKRFGVANFSDLTIENIQRIHNEMLKEVKESTADKFHDTVDCYIKRAVNVGLLPMDKNPYLKFKRKTIRYGDRKYLTVEELAKIEKKEFTVERLNFIKDMFLFCCYTGLAYADLQQLKPSNIVEEKGVLFIKTFREKTEEKAAIFVFEKARLLLEKYSGKRGGYCFPSISNQNFNSYLKEIADLAGVEKNLTVHVARHTFATTVMLLNGASLEVVKKALGHSKIATTEIYAKMVDSRVAAEMGSVEVKIEDAFLLS